MLEAADQSEQTGLYREAGLKETVAKTKCFRQRLNRGAAEVVCFLNIEGVNLFK